MKAICIKIPNPTDVAWRKFKIYEVVPNPGSISRFDHPPNFIMIYGVEWKSEHSNSGIINHCYITKKRFKKCFVEIKDE